MSRFIRSFILVLLAGSPMVMAQDISGDEMRSLDGQVQEVKSDVLSIASELGNLEERLLYPSNTQIALFVAIAEDQAFRLCCTGRDKWRAGDTPHLQLQGTRGLAEGRSAAHLYGQRRHRRPSAYRYHDGQA